MVVVEQRERPGGRAYQLKDSGFTWDTGPSLVTMPWVLEETFAAGGLDLRSEVKLRRLDPMYRILWDGEDEYFDFTADAVRRAVMMRSCGLLRNADRERQTLEQRQRDRPCRSLARGRR